MSLTKTIIPVTFKGGVNQKTPEKLVVPGEFLALENCVRRKTGSIEKRPGLQSLSDEIFSGGSVTSAVHLDTFEDDVIMLGDEKLYSYSPANDKWIDKGTCSSAAVDLVPYIRNANSQAMADAAYHSGLACVVYEDSSGGVRYSVYDDTTNAALVANAVLEATSERPRVVAMGSGFVIGYIKGAALVTRYVAYSTPTALGAEVTVAGSGVESMPWDLATYASYGIFAYSNASDVVVGYITQTGVVGSPGGNGLPAPAETGAAVQGDDAVTIVGDAGNNKIWLAFHNSAGDLYVYGISPDLSLFAGVTAATDYGDANITGVVEASGDFRLYTEQETTAGRIAMGRYSWGGSAASPTEEEATALLLNGAGLVSKAFIVGDHAYVITARESALQATYYVIREDGYIVSKALQGQGGGFTRDAAATRKSALCSVFVDSAGKYSSVLQVRNQLNISGGGITLASARGLKKVSLEFGALLFGKTLGRNYHIVGGSTMMYDGVSVTEHGFFLFPENNTSSDGTLTATAVAGGALTGSVNYSFRAVYEWTDGKGQIHRSAPSITTTVATTGTNKTINVSVPTLYLTNKDPATVTVVLYVAQADQSSVYYRYDEAQNDISAATVDFVINTEPSATAEILYTTGGILENIAPPPAKAIHLHKDRLFLGGVENKDGIYFSKYWSSGEGVGFQDTVRVPIESEGGDVTAFATMDDSLVIFKKSRIYVLGGEGPLDSGLQNDWTVPTKVVHDVGTVYPRSVVTTPKGVMFKSEKGIYLLNRGFTVDYIGAGVEDFNDLEITSATLLGDVDEVRFTTRDGAALVYNYFFDQWSTFTNYEAVGAAVGLGTYLHLKSDGTVRQEVAGLFDDDGRKVAMGIETSWFSTAGLQGFQRIYKILMLGDFVSHHYCKVKVAYDFETAYTQTINFNTETGLGTSTFGDDATYGSVSPYGGTGSSVFQCRLQPVRQKCESFKLRIEDQDTLGVTAGGSFKLVALTLEVGRKYGAYKLAATKSRG